MNKDIETQSQNTFDKPLDAQFPTQQNNSSAEGMNESKLIHSFSNPSTQDLQLFNQRLEMNWFQRFFSKMQKGSMRVVVLIWIRMSVGIGMFGLPSQISKLGVLHGSILLIISGFLSYICCKFVYECHHLTKFKNYNEITKEMLPSFAHKLFKITFLIDLASTPIIYSIVSWDLFKKITSHFKFMKDYMSDSVNETFNEYSLGLFIIRSIYFICLFLILTPLLLKKSLEGLKKISFIYLGVLLSLSLFLLFQYPYFYKHYKSTKEHEIEWYTKSFNEGWFSSFFIMVLAFYVQPFVMGMRSELFLPTLKRLSAVAKIGINIEIVFFLLLGVGGYIAFGDKKMKGLIFTRASDNVLNIYIEYAFLVVQGAFLFLLGIGIACFNPYLREYLQSFNLITNKKIEFYLYSLSPMVLACLIGIGYPKVLEILALLSLTISNYNGFIVPIMMKIKYEKQTKGVGLKVGALSLLCGFFIFAGMIGFCVEVNKQIIQKIMKKK